MEQHLAPTGYFLGPGINGEVYSVVCDNSGNVYVGGTFTTAGVVPAEFIAEWNGSAWSALGTGVNGTVRCLLLNSGNLYVGGQFNRAGSASANDVAVWSGGTWSALGLGMNGEVLSLAADGSGNIYAGGLFTTAGGSTANEVAEWNGTMWSTFGTGMFQSSAVVYSVAYASGILYAGGSFGERGWRGRVNDIAKWTGSAWSPLSTGLELLMPNVLLPGQFRHLCGRRLGSRRAGAAPPTLPNGTGVPGQRSARG